MIELMLAVISCLALVVAWAVVPSEAKVEHQVAVQASPA